MDVVNFFGDVPGMNDEELTGCFASCGTHPIWKGVRQVATELYAELLGVVEDPQTEPRHVERAIGGMAAMKGLMGECGSRIPGSEK